MPFIPRAEVTRRLLDLASKIDSGRFILAAYPDSLAAWIDSATCSFSGKSLGFWLKGTVWPRR